MPDCKEANIHAMPCMWSWRKMRVLYGRIQVCSLYDVCRNCKLVSSVSVVIWVDDPPSSRPQLCCSCCCPVGWFDELKPSPRSSSSGGLSPCPTREF
jgi:hypothetical protein